MNETWWVDPSQLDQQQTEILTATADVTLLIIGPPGSGKTNILMLRANYVRPIGPRQLFLTFTRSLAEHLRSGPNVGRADQIQREEISTFMGWARGMIKIHGGEIPDETGDFDIDRKSIVAVLQEIVLDQKLSQMYDVVFIDEVQDFWESELQIIRSLSDRQNFAGDSRQRIWRHREGLKTAAAMADETVELVRHYRIGENICSYADQILPPKTDQAPLIEGCNYPERLRPSSVEILSCPSIDEAIDVCIGKLKEQLRYITDEPIGIIGPYNDALDDFMKKVQSDPDLSEITVRQKIKDYHEYDQNSRVRVMTVHSAKGSEFRAVHLLEGEAFRVRPISHDARPSLRTRIMTAAA